MPIHCLKRESCQTRATTNWLQQLSSCWAAMATPSATCGPAPASWAKRRQHRQARRSQPWWPVNEAAPAPYAKQITKVYISEQITKDAFSKFVKVYPKWAEKIEYSTESTDKEHVSNVSWYGAQAYCQYLTDQLPADLKDKYIFRLPTEYEWEAYAKDGKDRPQSLWDWCQNWYAPAEVFYSNNVPDTFPGAEKAVRGGCRQAWVRGCQSPDWVTPYIGFRVVLVEK